MVEGDEAGKSQEVPATDVQEPSSVCTPGHSRKPTLTEESVRIAGLKYTTTRDFSGGDFVAYWTAVKLGILPELFPEEFSDTGPKWRKWTPSTISDAVKLCSTRTEFHTKFPGAYAAARSLGIMEKVCKRLPFHTRLRSPANMTDDELLKIGEKYPSANAFLRGNNSAYTQVVRRGLFRELSARTRWGI